MSGSFLDDIPIGQNVAGTSPLHSAWAPGKACVFLAVAVSTFFMGSATAFVVLGIILSVLAQNSGIGVRRFWRALRPVYFLAFFTIFTWAFISHENAGALSPNFSLDGLKVGGLYAARLVVITLLTTLFFLTTTAHDSIALGIRLLTPLRLLGIDRHELSLLVHLAYRFVPLLRREINEVKLGRLARNLPPPRGFRAKLSTAVDSLVFLFVGALHRAETTSYALEDRGILDTWVQPQPDHQPATLGGWWVLALIGPSALLAWKDGALL